MWDTVSCEGGIADPHCGTGGVAVREAESVALPEKDVVQFQTGYCISPVAGLCEPGIINAVFTEAGYSNSGIALIVQRPVPIGELPLHVAECQGRGLRNIVAAVVVIVAEPGFAKLVFQTAQPVRYVKTDAHG